MKGGPWSLALSSGLRQMLKQRLQSTEGIDEINLHIKQNKRTRGRAERTAES